jgi:Toluene-4-monooxygenase system protein B (TmoB)
MLVPLHAFALGDTMGVLVLVDDSDTIAELARRIAAATAMRVAPRGRPIVYVATADLNPAATVAASGLRALDRVNLRFG